MGIPMGHRLLLMRHLRRPESPLKGGAKKNKSKQAPFRSAGEAHLKAIMSRQNSQEQEQEQEQEQARPSERSVKASHRAQGDKLAESTLDHDEAEKNRYIRKAAKRESKMLARQVEAGEDDLEG